MYVCMYEDCNLHKCRLYSEGRILRRNHYPEKNVIQEKKVRIV